MSLEATIFGVVLVGVMLVFAVLPLLGGDSEPPSRFTARGISPRQRQALETLWAEKQRVLRSIRDLDFDYDMDKLTDDTYVTQRVGQIHLVIAIIKRMDEIEGEVAAQQNRIEAAVAALRQNRQPQPEPTPARGRARVR